MSQMFPILKSSSPVFSNPMSDTQRGPWISPVRSELHVTRESLCLKTLKQHGLLVGVGKEEYNISWYITERSF